MVLYESVIHAKKSKINGLWLEFGTWKGETINFISHLTNEKVYGFDSFRGLPEDWISKFPKGTFDRKGKLPEVRKNVSLIKGSFENSIGKFLKGHKNIPVKFLHVDCDIYSSASVVFNLLKDTIIPGTIIVFDELIGYKDYKKHEFKAFNEFLEVTGYNVKILCHNNYEQVVVRILR